MNRDSQNRSRKSESDAASKSGIRSIKRETTAWTTSTHVRPLSREDSHCISLRLSECTVNLPHNRTCGETSLSESDEFLVLYYEEIKLCICSFFLSEVGVTNK